MPTDPPADHPAARPVRVGVDVGGTFTDLVALDGDRLVLAKVPSTPGNQAEGVMEALRAAGLPPDAPVQLCHGTTVATNALLERRGARVALVTTEGFRDLIEIARQDRPSLYDLELDRPAPLVPRDRRFVVSERMGPDGCVTPLDPASLERAVEACRQAEVEAVAVGLLFGYLHPAHEQQVADALRAALGPVVAVVASHEVLPEFREYERLATTVAAAYLQPVVGRYLANLLGALASVGIERPSVMQSSGGSTPMARAATDAAGLVLSGPAGGVVGAAQAAVASGFPDALTFDMGGTSTDVAPLLAGEVATTTGSVVAGVPIGLPMVDVHTVSAGGGSLGWVDDGGALRVGPRSAGAVPGPACYGQGGTQPTVTDADLTLGWLPDGAVLGGRVRLDRGRAEAALTALGAPLGLDGPAVALGIVRVAEAQMAAALRVISVERGLDPRRFALVAFGGAGGMHACALAEELQIERVLVPRTAGVLSAQGLAVADERHDLVAPFRAVVAEEVGAGLVAAFTALEATGVDRLASGGGRVRRQADLRYVGQSFELTVPLDLDDEEGARVTDRLAADFHQAHDKALGYRMDQEPVELVAIRVSLVSGQEVVVAGEPPQPPDAGDPVIERRPACIDQQWSEVPVFARDRMGAGSTLAGPAIVAFAETTVVVGRAWTGAVDDHGTLVLARSASPEPAEGDS